MPFTLKTPAGLPITGTKDRLIAIAEVSGFEDDGEPIYTGNTVVDWNSQRQMTDESGRRIYVDSEGNEWTMDELIREEE